MAFEPHQSSSETRTPDRPTVVVVDDDGATLQKVRSLLSSHAHLLCFTSVTQTFDWLREASHLDGAITDLGLPDGSGYEIVRALREKFPHAFLLVLTGRYDPRAINRVQLLEAQYVLKPDFDANLKAFAARIHARVKPHELSPQAALEQFFDRYPLTRRERVVLELSVKGVPRAHLPDALGVSENTVKAQIRSMLAKCGESSLADLVWRVQAGQLEQDSCRAHRGEAESPQLLPTATLKSED